MPSRSAPCRLCGALSAHVVEYDVRRFSGYWADVDASVPNVEIRRCRRFGSYFTASMPAPALIEGQYGVDWDEYYARDEYSPRRRVDRCLSQIARFVRPGSRVMDVGGGNGAFAMAATATYEAWFQELNPGRTERLREAGVTTVRSVEEAPAGTFDAITLWDVYEHVWPHDGFLEPISRALAPDGLLVIEVPSPSRLVPVFLLLGRVLGSPKREAALSQVCDYSHLQLMTPRELIHDLRTYGFDPVHLETLSELSYAGIVYARRVVPSDAVAKLVGSAFDWRPLRRALLGNNKTFVVARRPVAGA